jgi:hypothetical protein
MYITDSVGQEKFRGAGQEMCARMGASAVGAVTFASGATDMA